MISKNIKNALLEAARLLVFSVPGILLQVVTKDAALSAAYGGAILTALKAIDRAIHEDPTNKASGILPF